MTIRAHWKTTAFRSCALLILAVVMPVTSGADTGVIGGRILVPEGQQRPEAIFLENLETEVVEVVEVVTGQASYTAEVVPGAYRAYSWLPDFSLMGGYTGCGAGQTCTDHVLLSIEVAVGQTVVGVDIADWHVPESPVVALTGRLIDGSGSEPVEGGVLVIWEQHILAVGPEAQLSIPSDAVHYDLPGMTILPGFINAHVHNVYVPRNLRLWAESGVTTVRDLGAPVDSSWERLRDFLDDDPGYARILAAGPLVTCPGGYPIDPIGFASLTVDSEEEARTEINRLIDRGADVIKIVIESGVREVLSEELATVIVDTAHARGIPVTVHLNLARDLRTAINAGVDDVAHMVLDYVSDEMIQEMVDRDIGWVPTLAIMAGNGGQMYNNLGRFVEAGGRVALGNDAGYLDGVIIGMPVPELEWMEFAGMTPMQVIVSATSDAAVICRRQDLLGSLEAGKLADVLVVEGDPLVDLRALGDVRMVIHEGVIIRHELATPREAGGRAGQR